MTAALAALVGFCALVGLAIGSFLNVVIHRIPIKQSVVRPRSHCPSCGTQLSERDNVPVLSWLLLRGRCRSCHEPISMRYPLVEVATAGLFAAAAVRFGFSYALPGYCLFFAALLAISVIDLDHFIVPNRIIYPTLFATVPLLAGAALLDGSWKALEHATLGGLMGFGALLIVHMVSPRGMGFGDVRLAGIIGIYLGWLGYAHILLGLFLGFLLASVVGLGLIATRLRTRRDALPFAPFLAAGAMLAVLWGHLLLRIYARGRG